MSERRIGVFGGTFDPIHYGHLRLAEAALQKFDLEKILFVPSGQPPHKFDYEVSSARDRLAMTILGAANQPRFHVSSIEVDRAGVSYTVDTLIELVKTCGKECRLYFIIGADAVLGMPDWHDSHRVLNLCTPIIATRPGTDINDLNNLGLTGLLEGSLFLQDLNIGISATEIRRRIGLGESIQSLTPELVERYILTQGLYRKSAAG